MDGSTTARAVLFNDGNLKRRGFIILVNNLWLNRNHRYALIFVNKLP